MKKLTTLINEALADDNREMIGTITEALKTIFASYSIPVVLDNVAVNEDVITLNISITEDKETEEFEIHFYVDEDGIPQALVIEDDDDEDEYYTYSLEGIASKELSNDGEVVDFIEPTWFEESVMTAILTADIESELEEKFQFVVRDGKKVKKKLVRQKRRRVLTSKQKAGIRKAVKSRRTKKGQTARKRKMSNKLRKRMKLGKNTNKQLKVAGTSSRK